MREWPMDGTRLCLERGARLTPLLRIRAAGCAMSMAMQREYSDFYQSVTGSVKGASIDPSEPGTAAAEKICHFPGQLLI